MMKKTSEIKYNKPRYKYIENIVINLYINFNIQSYPVNVKKIIKSFNNCRVVSYKKFMEKKGLSYEEVYKILNTDEGCAIYEAETDRYIVFYNNLTFEININGFRYSGYLKTPERQRWTLAHELGHILLGHHVITNKTRIFRNTLTDEEYNWMEKEANYFASLLLANPIILYKLSIKNSSDIAKICGLSQEASEYRFKDYKKWVNNKYKKIHSKYFLILHQFHDFIYKHHCPNCGYSVISNKYVYCPICGQKLQWGDGNMIYNDGYELDENGRALICPKCGNEQIGDDPEEQFCIICGTYLVNKCTNIEGQYAYGQEVVPPCGKIVPGNARYCPYCGSETTFFRNGILKPWQEAKKQIEALNFDEELDELPDDYEMVSEDDLPF